MRVFLAAIVFSLATPGALSAQQLSVSGRTPGIAAAANVAVANAVIAVDSPHPFGASEPIVRTLLADDPVVDANEFAARLLERVPIERIQQALRTRPALRVVEAAVGAALIGYELRHPSSASTVAQIGLDAMKFSGSRWLDRGTFHADPQIRDGGFAITFSKRR